MRKMRWTCCCCCCCWGRWRCCCCCCCWCCWPVPPWPVVVGDWSPHRPPRPSLRNGQTDGNLLAWGHRQRCSPPMLGMPAMPAMRARPPQQQESRPLAAAAENQGPVGAGWGWDAGDSSDSRPGIPAMPAIPPPPPPGRESPYPNRPGCRRFSASRPRAGKDARGCSPRCSASIA